MWDLSTGAAVVAGALLAAVIVWAIEWSKRADSISDTSRTKKK